MEIIGRQTSHFTRLARIFAHELSVPITLVPIYEMTSEDPAIFAGNPALKIPTLRHPQGLVFGSENICRRLAELSPTSRRIVWPESVASVLAGNAHELLQHSMAAQVQWVLGTVVCKLPADNAYFHKGRKGFEGALQWLDAHLHDVLAGFPRERDLSFFEVGLFCLVDHLVFRQTLPIEPYPALASFANDMGRKPSALATPYRFDAPR